MRIYKTNSMVSKNEISYFFRLRILSLSIIFVILLAVCLSVIFYPENAGPKGIVNLSWAIALLILYSIFCFFLPWYSTSDEKYIALRKGTFFGSITGVIWMIHVTVEHFINLPGKLNGITTLAFMFSNFILFGLTAFITMKRTGKLGVSLLSSVWCAMFSILLLIIYVSILIMLFTRTFENDLNDEFKKSGMSGIKSFIVNNTLESASTHLFEAPVIAVIFSLIIIGVWKIKKIIAGKLLNI